MNPSDVAIVVPCYNESARLPVGAFEVYLARADCTIIFVDDGSSDGTADVLNTIRKGREDRVVVLRSAANRGKAEAVRYGMQHAFERQTRLAGFWDADLATPLDAIGDFCSVLDSHPEVEMVFGSRVRLLGRKIERRAARHYAGRAFATVVSSVLRMPVYDTQCGAKMFRVVPRICDIFKQPFLSRWVFDVEMVARYILQVGSPDAAAARIYELPLNAWTDVRGSRLKGSDFAMAFRDVCRIYWKYMRTVPPG